MPWISCHFRSRGIFAKIGIEGTETHGRVWIVGRRIFRARECTASHGFEWFDHGHHRSYREGELSTIVRGVGF